MGCQQIKYILLVIWIHFSSIFLCAQDAYSFKQISVEQGLPGNNVMGQFQDSRGVMWIAIEAMGLCRYDGHKFKLFTNRAFDPTSLSSNFINSINEDALGNIWIGTDYGLNMYDFRTGIFRAFYYNSEDSVSIPDNVINSVDRDNAGNIWLSTANGIAMLNTNTFTFKRYLFSSSRNKDYLKTAINKVYQGKNGNFWLGGYSGLLKFNLQSNTFSRWGNSNGDENYNISGIINDIVEDKYGNIWIGRGNGIDKFNIRNESIEHFNFLGEDLLDFQYEGINCMMLNENEMLWCGTSTKGIIVINTRDNTYERITKSTYQKNGFQSDHVRSVYKDNTGALWIGTKFGGIFRLVDNNRAFNKWPEKYELLKQLSNQYIMDVFEDNENVYWISTTFNGLYKVDFNKNTIINYSNDLNNPQSISSNRIRKVIRDSKNNLWIGTDLGLDLLNESTNTFKHIGNKLILNLLEDSFGNFWVGTIRGVFVLNRDNLSLEKYISALETDFFDREDYYIMDIEMDDDTNVYFSTRLQGLFVLDLKTNMISSYSKNNSTQSGINANMIRQIFEDDNKNIWVGTKEAGLRLFDKKNNKFIIYDINDGLPSNMVLCIEQDFSGNLWLGTDNGLSRFDIKNNIFTNFNSNHGLKSSVSATGANHRFKDGALLFGGGNGFNVFYPDDIVKSDKTSPLLISSLKIVDKEVYRDLTNSIDLELTHEQRSISFEFFIANYSQPSRHQFKCYMEGLDNSWNNLGNRNYTSYTNLSPGTYVFHVAGANELGLWSNELTVNIHISKPWWETLVAIIFFTLLIISIILFFYYVRLHQISRQKKELEHQVDKRTTELIETNVLLEEHQQQIEEQSEELKMQAEELFVINENLIQSNTTKDKLFSIIAHDLKNPLNTVLGYCQLIIKRQDKLEYGKVIKMVKNIYDSSSNIYILLENLLQWARSQIGNLKVISEKVSLYRCIQENEELLKDMIENKKIIVENNVPDFLYTFSDKQIISTVIRNLFANAVKYTEDGCIVFNVEVKNSEIVLKVKDTGVGISSTRLQTLFEIGKSDSTQGTRGEHGTGLGLIVCKEFVELNGGHIFAESQIGEGTTFVFSCPLFEG